MISRCALVFAVVFVVVDVVIHFSSSSSTCFILLAFTTNRFDSRAN